MDFHKHGLLSKTFFHKQICGDKKAEKRMLECIEHKCFTF